MPESIKYLGIRFNFAVFAGGLRFSDMVSLNGKIITKKSNALPKIFAKPNVRIASKLVKWRLIF
jgi:hypothetical protein